MAKRTYENDDIIVYWDSDLCIHVAECLKGNGEVFNLNQRPWVDLSKAPAEEIARVIDLRPSGALKDELKKK
jgi:uncharacterized Fe-S cluster protein YjdI